MADLTPYLPFLESIRAQREEMIRLTHDWSSINSGSFHLEGLARMLDALEAAFAPLGGERERLDLPPLPSVNARGEPAPIPLGQALRIRKRPQAPLQIFLGGHYDTVFGREHPFQTARFMDDVAELLSPPSASGGGRILNAPGAADLKGGLAVMLKALEAFERSPWAEKLGWEILLNPDEEIGSQGSAHLLREAAGRCHLGLVYEPSLPDGTLVAGRKGSGNFAIVARGRAAHAGREFEKGRNAIAALGEVIQAVWKLNGRMPGVTVNPGKIEGGGALNVVPDLAILRFNVRVASAEEQAWFERALREEVFRIESRESSDAALGSDSAAQSATACLLTTRHSPLATAQRDGITLELHGGFTRPPKIVNEGIRRLQAMVEETGALLGQPVRWQDTGGCCDGNNLAAYGLPNIDTLGVRGGNIHSDKEYVLLDSLTERAELSALLLMRLASGEISWL